MARREGRRLINCRSRPEANPARRLSRARQHVNIMEFCKAYTPDESQRGNVIPVRSPSTRTAASRSP